MCEILELLRSSGWGERRGRGDEKFTVSWFMILKIEKKGVPSNRRVVNAENVTQGVSKGVSLFFCLCFSCVSSKKRLVPLLYMIVKIRTRSDNIVCKAQRSSWLGEYSPSITPPSPVATKPPHHHLTPSLFPISLTHTPSPLSPLTPLFPSSTSYSLRNKLIFSLQFDYWGSTFWISNFK